MEQVSTLERDRTHDKISRWYQVIWVTCIAEGCRDVESRGDIGGTVEIVIGVDCKCQRVVFPRRGGLLPDARVIADSCYAVS